jgi:hypothetical protein
MLTSYLFFISGQIDE